MGIIVLFLRQSEKEALMIERKVVYFEKPGRENTEKCLDVVKRALKEGACRSVVVASTEGDTGLLFSGALGGEDVNLVVVTHSAGFKEPNASEMSGETREKIIAAGAALYTGSMLTHSIETALMKGMSGFSTSAVVAQSLRRFGEGSKVCCEITMMAVDAGLVPEAEEVIAVAGTARGADTVLVVKSAASKRFLDLRVLEVLAKPRA